MPSVASGRVRPTAPTSSDAHGKIWRLMEKRAILAAVLMAALLMVYQFLFVRPEPQPGGSNGQKSEAPAPPANKAPTEAPSQAPPPPAKEAPLPPEQTAIVDTPLFRAQVSSTGGELKQWELNFRGQKPMAVPGVLGWRGVEIARQGVPPRPVPFVIEPQE